MTTLQEHSSTPAVLRRGANTSGTATSAAFTPPDKSLIVVLLTWKLAADTYSGTVTVRDNHGNTFASRRTLNANSTNGSEFHGIYWRYYDTSPGSTIITATNTNTGRASVHLAPRVLTGGDDTQSGATVAVYSYNASIAPTGPGSVIYAVGGIKSTAGASVRSDCTGIDSWTDLVNSQSGTRQYHLSDSQTFHGSDGGNPNQQRTDVGNEMHQGGTTDSGGTFNGTQKALGIISGNPSSDLAGVDIGNVRIRLTNTHSWYNAGLTVDLGYTSRTSIPGSWNASDVHGIKNYHMDENDTHTEDLTGLGFGTALQNGSARSISIGPGSGSYNLDYYGTFTGAGSGGSNPLISVDWSLDTNLASLFLRRTALTSGTGSVIVGWDHNVESMIAVEIQPATAIEVDGFSSTQTAADGALILKGFINGLSVTASHADGTIPVKFEVDGLSATASWALGVHTKVVIVDASSRTPSYGDGWLKPSALFKYPLAGSQEIVTAQILNSSLVAQMPIQFVTLTAQLYYNQVGSWTIVVPYSDALWNVAMAGDCIVEVNWRNLFTFGGKCEQPGYTDSLPGARQGGSSGVSTPGPYIVLSGGDYLALLANKIAYPNPAVAWGSQTAGATDAVSGARLETAIKHYVNLNVGAGALAARRHNLLDIAADALRGGTISYTVKFAANFSLNLMDILRAMINNAGGPTGMGLRISRNGHRLLFDVYVPRDLTNKAWFSQDLGNLTSVNLSITDPTCTDALVRGSASFVSRTATARTQWNITEQYIDQSSDSDANNLAAAAQTALLTGAAGPTLGVTPTDSPFLTFGRDYYLGDIVTVEVVPGASYSDVVSSVVITADPSQDPAMSVVPNLGRSADATATDSSIIGQLTARIKSLEKRLGM